MKLKVIIAKLTVSMRGLPSVPTRTIPLAFVASLERHVQELNQLFLIVLIIGLNLLLVI
jgi:hypothetical protein